VVKADVDAAKADVDAAKADAAKALASVRVSYCTFIL